MPSPLEVSILLHYWTTPEDFNGGDFSAPAVLEAMENFQRIGILRHVPGHPLKLRPNNEALKVYIDAITAIPLPIQKTVWALPRKV